MKSNGWKMMAVAGFAALGGVMWSQVIAPRDAVGYPSGAAVSYGANPVVSGGGYLDLSSTVGTTTRVSASPGLEQAGSALVITGVTLGTTTGGSCVFIADVFLEDSVDTLASFTIDRNFYGSSASGTAGMPWHVSYPSGISVADGETLSITATVITSNGCTSTASGRLYYTLSGYYAEP